MSTDEHDLVVKLAQAIVAAGLHKDEFKYSQAAKLFLGDNHELQLQLLEWVNRLK